MAWLQRRDDAFKARAKLERVECFLVCTGEIFRPACVPQKTVLWADSGIIKAGRDRVCVDDLTVIGLQQIGLVTMQNAGRSAIQGGRVLAGLDAMT